MTSRKKRRGQEAIRRLVFLNKITRDFEADFGRPLDPRDESLSYPTIDTWDEDFLDPSRLYFVLHEDGKLVSKDLLRDRLSFTEFEETDSDDTVRTFYDRIFKGHPALGDGRLKNVDKIKAALLPVFNEYGTRLMEFVSSPDHNRCSLFPRLVKETEHFLVFERLDDYEPVTLERIVEDAAVRERIRSGLREFYDVVGGSDFHLIVTGLVENFLYSPVTGDVKWVDICDLEYASFPNTSIVRNADVQTVFIFRDSKHRDLELAYADTYWGWGKRVVIDEGDEG
jgi:hypothetical protein